MSEKSHQSHSRRGLNLSHYSSERELLRHSLDRRILLSDAVMEATMAKLTRFIIRLPTELKQLAFDHLATIQDINFGRIERPHHIHLLANRMLKPLPPVHTIEGTVDPSLDWIDYAEEAIAKTSVIHITTNFTQAYPQAVQDHANHIRHLSLSIPRDNSTNVRMVTQRVRLIKNEFPNLESLEVWDERNFCSIDWIYTGGMRITQGMLEVMTGIQVRGMLVVRDIDRDTGASKTVWHGRVYCARVDFFHRANYGDRPF